MSDDRIRLYILGATGSVGQQTLDVVRQNPDKFVVVGMSGGSNVDLLARCVAEFAPKTVGIAQSDKKDRLVAMVGDGIKVYTGIQAQTVVGESDADIVVAAVSGVVGLHGVVAAIECGKKVAIANKESLVAAGNWVVSLARRHSVEIIPIDSEHSAIRECLQGHRRQDVKRLILTASGGPFYFYSKEQLAQVKPCDAIKHPNWTMGKKVSVDSATMFNKGLELFEARWLYDTLDVDYIVHRESVIHSMVEYVDGSIVAQLSYPDMRLPIQQAISPYKIKRDAVTDLVALSPISFYPVDEERFPAPRLAMEIMAKGDSILACVYNSANEVAVRLFLEGKIAYLDIYDIVKRSVEEYKDDSVIPDMESVLAVDKQVAASIIERLG